MPASAGSSISLSSAHIYTLERDPNKSPPTRLNHLPISSQTSPSSPPSSSTVKRPSSSSNEVDRNLTEMILDPMDDEDDEDDDDEFQGLEMIGNTQWEKEVPNFQHKSKKRKITSSYSSIPSSPLQKIDQENKDWNVQDEIDELDESDWDIPFDLIQSQEEDQNKDEGVEQVALHSPIVAGPSSPPMRTPAFSLPSVNSDIPSGPYPQTPQTHNREFNHNHQFKDTDRSTPISWSPSPLNSKDKNEISKRSMLMLSDDSDVEVDQENRHPMNIPSLLLGEKHRDSPPLSSSRKGRSRKRIVESDEDEEEEPLAVQKRRREKGKQRESSQFHEDKTVTGSDPSKAAAAAVTLDNLFDDEGNDENYDPTREEGAEVLDIEEEEEEFDFDEFGDFPFDEIDLDLKSRTTISTRTRTRTRSKSKSKSISPQKQTLKQKNQSVHSLSNDLFPPDEEDIFNIEDDEEDGYAIQPSNQNHYVHGNNSELDKVDKAKKYEGNEEWHIYLIDELDDKWQDFYKNHWRRGVDKIKKSNIGKNSTRIGAILSEDEVDEEEERDIRPAKRGTASASTSKRGGAGVWGWRGRGRAAWRGRGASRVRGGGGRGRNK